MEVTCICGIAVHACMYSYVYKFISLCVHVYVHMRVCAWVQAHITYMCMYSYVWVTMICSNPLNSDPYFVS